MAKLYKAGKHTDACKISIHPILLQQLGWEPGDEINIQIKGKKLVLSKED